MGIMTEETKQKLRDAGRQDLIDIHEINQSGFAGILSNGNIVDRRKHPEAIPVQENSLFGIPKAKTKKELEEAIANLKTEME